MIALMLALSAFAADPDPTAITPDHDVNVDAAESTDAPPDADAFTVIVWGEAAIERARAKVSGDLDKLGWKPHRENGEIMFTPPEAWLGRAHLGDDGSLVFGRPVMKAGPEFVSETPGSTGIDARMPPAPTVQQSFYLLPTKDRLDAAEARVLRDIGPDLDAYRSTLAASRFQSSLAALPAELDALWTNGTPPGGGTPIADKVARRQAILDLWATRSDTPEGDAASGVIATWIRNTLTSPADRPTADEVARAEKKRTDGRKLGL